MCPRRLLMLAMLAAALAPPHLAAAEDAVPEPPPLYRKLKVSLGYHYSNGRYGNAQATEIDYVPLVLTADIDRWRVQATIPYLHISGPPGIVEGPNGPIQTTNGTSDGLGDLLASVSYLLPLHRLVPTYASRLWMPFVDLSALVKFPTARRSDGLGTGEFDVGVECELLWVVDKLTPYLSGGYRYLGSTPQTRIDNVAVATVGAQYQFLQALSAGLLLDYGGAPTPTTGQRLEIVPYATWIFLFPWSVDAYAAAGLAEGSPDAAVGFQVGYTW